MRFLRYPGGKSRLVEYLRGHLPSSAKITGNYIEPFVGGASIFLSIKPANAILSDINSELIELFKGIKLYPHKVWEYFAAFPKGRQSYYKIRDSEYTHNHLSYRAARTLYLNRTCFKGMWRHGQNGNFNVGYGGEDRRSVITHDHLCELSELFRNVTFNVSDFEGVIKNVDDEDYLFLDPPYKPGEKELSQAHYAYGKFTYSDQIRLANNLKFITDRKNIKWLMTNSSHCDIKHLYKGYNIRKVPYGTGNRIGVKSRNAGEIVISNY